MSAYVKSDVCHRPRVRRVTDEPSHIGAMIAAMEAAPAASLAGITRRFAKTVALDSVDFQVRCGEVVALLGPNGAGKTTLVRILLGLIRPTIGSVTLWGLPPDAVAARRRVGVMLQVGRVPETLTVREHVHLFASYYATPQPIDRTLAQAGATNVADRRFGDLSGGERQRALFALAICGNPDLLVLDEPTVGLDVEARRAFWVLVRGMIDRGTSVLLTTHYLEEADAVSDRIVVLSCGRIVADGTPAAIKQRVAARKVRCSTIVPEEVVRGIAGVQSVTRDRGALAMLTTNAEHLARELLARDPALRDLEITGAGLEEAFLALTAIKGQESRIENSHVAAVRA
jgi:ABC-2 type transport system ATP-binding protein